MSYFQSPSGLVLPSSAGKSSNANQAKPNNVAKLGKLSIWARNGFVCMSKELDNGEEEYDQVNTRSARARMKALGELTDAMRKQDHPDYAKIRTNQRFLSIYEDVIRQAEEQGPFEYEDMRRARVNARPVTKSVMAGIDSGKVGSDES